MNVPPRGNASRALGGLVARTVVTVLAAAVVAGVGAGVAAADTVTDTTATETTAPAQSTVTVTEQQTTTVQQTVHTTVTHPATVQPTATATTAATTTSSASGGGFPTWAIVLIVVAGIGLVAAVAYLLGRGRKGADSALDGRRRILDAAVSSAVASGWTVESTSQLGAVIRRNGDRAVLTVDEHGQIIRRPLEGDEPTP
jgi:hypothetical protein